MNMYLELIGKYVEINSGDEHDSLYYNDSQQSRKSIICGIVDSYDIEEKTIKLIINLNGDSTYVYIPVYSIKAILLSTPSISINDIYVDDFSLKKNAVKKLNKLNKSVGIKRKL